ncbi:MAG: hypothetical protein R3C11_27445 [Planctomycetaceae bacterium]
MKIAVASDHRGFDVKGKILDLLKSLGHEGEDLVRMVKSPLITRTMHPKLPRRIP